METKHTITFSLTFERMTERTAEIWLAILLWISLLLPRFVLASFLIEDEEEDPTQLEIHEQIDRFLAEGPGNG